MPIRLKQTSVGLYSLYTVIIIYYDGVHRNSGGVYRISLKSI